MRGVLADVISRLTELHEQAEGEDRRRVALLLGQAIADQAAELPDFHPDHGQLAEQGTALLDESGEDSPAVQRARELLTRSRQLSRGPDSFGFEGPDLKWDMDWEEARGLNEMARNLRETMPRFAAAFPADSPLRQALTDIADVMGAFEREEWTGDKDVVLKRAIQEVDHVGLPGIGMILRLLSMFVRVRRCRLAEQEGRHPQWPPLAEIDALITEFETTDVTEYLQWGTVQSIEGVPHVMIAFLMMMRLVADLRGGESRRDVVWRDETLRLLDRVEEHLDRAPPFQAGLVRMLRGNLARPRADLLRWVPPPAPAGPGAAEPAPTPPPAPPVQEPPEQVPLWHKLIDEAYEDAALAGGEHPFSLRNLVGPTLTPGGLTGVRLLAQAGESDVLLAQSHLVSLQETAVTERWTEAAERELAELERKCGEISSRPDPSPTDRAKAAGMLAMGRAIRWYVLSRSPRLTERPSAEQGAALVTELEAALDLMAAAAKEPDVSSLGSQAGLLHALASSLLIGLGRSGGRQPDPELNRRARDHLDQVPAELIKRLPPIMGDIFLLQEILADGRRATPEESARLADQFGDLYDPLAAAEAAVAEVRKDITPQSLGKALTELNQAGISLPAGNPLHFRRLILLAETQRLAAGRISDPNGLNDALGTAIDAGRIASTPDKQRAAAQQLVLIFGVMNVPEFLRGAFPAGGRILSDGTGGRGARRLGVASDRHDRYRRHGRSACVRVG